MSTAIRAVLSGRGLPIAWVAVAAILAGLAVLLVGQQARFDWALPLKEIPARGLTLGLVAAGAAYLLVLPLARATAESDDDLQRRLLAFVVIVGLGLRLAMLATEPALEDDQQRYLWEGAVTAHGISPYRVAPADAISADRNTLLGQLAEQAGPVLDRVNHPHLKTIYPPMALGAFALAHWIAPFDLTAWRLVLLTAECGTLALMLALLARTGRAPIWCALYWWNPVAIKEIINSGHMDGLLPPLILGALWLAAKRRHVTSIGVLGLAVGVKVWPVLLAPLLLRPLLAHGKRLAGALTLFVILLISWALPIWLGGIDERSGFVAYASQWQANGALLPALRDYVVAPITGMARGPAGGAGSIARLMLAGIAGAVALIMAFRPLAGTDDLLHRAAVITLVLVLVSPAQFPWYVLWTLPLLPFAPRLGVTAMAVLVPLYYLSFYFSSLGAYAIFRDRVVWLIWLPIWLILFCEAYADWRGRRRYPPLET